jgi:hypothetical protein
VQARACFCITYHGENGGSAWWSWCHVIGNCWVILGLRSIESKVRRSVEAWEQIGMAGPPFVLVKDNGGLSSLESAHVAAHLVYLVVGVGIGLGSIAAVVSSSSRRRSWCRVAGIYWVVLEAG